jgi:glutamyl-tRNA reductase
MSEVLENEVEPIVTESSIEPEAAKPTSTSSTNLSEAVRDALKEVGADSTRDKTEQVRELIRQKYPHLAEKLKTNTFNSTLATIRQKVRLANTEKAEKDDHEEREEDNNQEVHAAEESLQNRHPSEMDDRFEETNNLYNGHEAPTVHGESYDNEVNLTIDDIEQFVKLTGMVKYLLSKFGSKQLLMKFVDML